MNQLTNAIGRVLPEAVEGYGKVRPFAGAFATVPAMMRQAPKIKRILPDEQKLVKDIETVFKQIPIKDGMTLSFHHHLRNGDGVVNMVLAVAAKLGLKNLTVALSSVFPVHAPLVEHVKNGVVAGLDTNYMSGPVAQAVSQGVFPRPVVFRTHGGRARAIECGQLKIDVAFIAAPAADDYGNINGVAGPAACGSLGYAFPDAQYADHVVAITDHLVSYPLSPVSIPQTRVDYVVQVDCIGDPQGIVSGTTKITRDPVGLKIAETTAKVIKAAGLLKEGFSFQTGAGGASLAAAAYVRQMMEDEGVTGSFALGGITGYMVEMLEAGLFRNLVDVQGFDLDAVRSIAANPQHLEIGADFYASPFNRGAAVNKLDVVVLGATEIDTAFNVNVVTGSDGVVMGGSGGHSDAAAGAKMTIIVANLLRGRLPIIVDKVLTATTPGETVDVLVTERGVAVNPQRQDLYEKFKAAGLPLKNVEELKQLAEKIAGVPQQITTGDNIVAVVEYRDGTVIDVVRQIK
ncbi:citrate lyase subunit alpha [Sporomusa acidovorans]|uniref:Citrate lyase alpha chain n=1 Tax=Sporomusa acidovorans (strain ATCC 49682 / DSM 3132 / Mol) TaxID=1123286 RepID=A0ABZ3J093_SPOA4|nr:citrate lyase subunit alpha [Sporomusa acidovorans]OZC22799.1 citrate lyase alpha chain [Sporomusa acidovorans DSM 3132]SDE51339.1 citrate lyase subunit alpha / citrate CoA-transferase [Sporomusa acidovorans]